MTVPRTVDAGERGICIVTVDRGSAHTPVSLHNEADAAAAEALGFTPHGSAESGRIVRLLTGLSLEAAGDELWARHLPRRRREDSQG